LAWTYINVLLIGPCQLEDSAEQLCRFDPSARPCPEQVSPFAVLGDFVILD